MFQAAQTEAVHLFVCGIKSIHLYFLLVQFSIHFHAS